MQDALVGVNAMKSRFNKNEASLKAESFGLNPGASEAQFHAGIPRLLEEARKVAKQHEAGHTPEALARFHQQGGVTSQDLPGGDAPAAGPHGASVTQHGHTYNWNAATGKYE